MSEGKSVNYLLSFSILLNFSRSLTDIHSSLLNLPAYAAHEDFGSYAHWAQIDGRDTANQLIDNDGKPASIVVIGQVMQDRLAVGPLGNYQIQEDKRSHDGNSFGKVTCKDAKIQLFLRRPTAFPEWIAEYDTAATRFSCLQETVATSPAPRQWFLEKTQNSYIMKFNHVLWDKKVRNV